jgi:hypothetical protein
LFEFITENQGRSKWALLSCGSGFDRIHYFRAHRDPDRNTPDPDPNPPYRDPENEKCPRFIFLLSSFSGVN